MPLWVDCASFSILLFWDMSALLFGIPSIAACVRSYFSIYRMGYIVIYGNTFVLSYCANTSIRLRSLPVGVTSVPGVLLRFIGSQIAELLLVISNLGFNWGSTRQESRCTTHSGIIAARLWFQLAWRPSEQHRLGVRVHSRSPSTLHSRLACRVRGRSRRWA